MSQKHCKECGRLLISISWSGLRTHEDCKQKSYLARTKKLATLDNKRNFFPGTVTDRVVRNWLLNSPAQNRGIMPDMVTETVDRERKTMADKGEGVVHWRDDEDRASIEADCREAVTKIEPVLMKYVVPFEYQPDFAFKAPVQLLNPVTNQMETVTLRGYMDILVRTAPDKWWVWDVKHTKDNSYWRKTVGQLGFYDLAVELQFGTPTVQTGLMQPLCDQRVKPYKPSEQSRTELMARIYSMAKDIWRKDHTPKPVTSGCSWCPTKHACIQFKPVVDDWNEKRVVL